MGFNLKLKTVAACQVARLDRQRFNELVASGDYPCAPDTEPGRTRLFEEIDLIALFVFARELEKQQRPAVAGQIARRIREVLEKFPDAEVIRLARDFLSRGFHVINTDRSAAEAKIGALSVFSITEYNIAEIRSIVRKGVVEAMEIIGSEDE